MVALRILGIMVLVVLALLLGALALGAFASLNYAAPLWLHTLSLPEGIVSTRLGLSGVAPMLRAVGLMLAAALLVYLAASWPPVVSRSAGKVTPHNTKPPTM